MIRKFFLPLISCLCFSCTSTTQSSNVQSVDTGRDNFIRYEPVKLTQAEKQILGQALESLYERYDPEEKMLTKALSGYNYHTDAESGVFHEVRGSLSYAVGLLDIGDEQYTERAFDIIEKTISLQDTDSSSRTLGIWPYYMEEPLATKKSPADFNVRFRLNLSILVFQVLPSDLHFVIER